MTRSVFAILDPVLLLLLCTVGLATVLPVQGAASSVVGVVTDIAIASLFFFHGAKLSREAIWAGVGHWRLHLTALGFTYVLFPLLGLSAGLLAPTLFSPAIAAGLLYLCLLPATVQSAIAFTSLAGGNVPAAICSASASNLLGVFLTPLLVGILMQAGGTVEGSVAAIQSIMLQLLVPFLAGHLARPLIGDFVARHKKLISYTDRSSILLVIYSAFSAAMINGLWHKVGVMDLVAITGISLIILAIVLSLSGLAGQRLGFARADRITLMFCASKKSLVSGVPMASVLFPVDQLGLIILPLMIFHQLQLIVCAWLAARLRRKLDDEKGEPLAEPA